MSWQTVGTVFAVAISVGSLALSALNARITVRQAERSWARESSVEALVDFMQASYSGAIRKIYAARQQGQPFEALVVLRDSSYTMKLTCLTRLKLISSGEIVGLAKQLHQMEEQLHERVLGPQEQLPTVPEFEALKKTQNDLRDLLVSTARRYFEQKN